MHPPKDLKEKLLYAESILVLAKKSELISIQELYASFARTLVSNLGHPIDDGDSVKKKLKEVSVKALKYLSVKPSSQRELFSPSCIDIFLGYLNDFEGTLERVIHDQESGHMFCSILTTLTNCLISDELLMGNGSY